MNNLNEIINDAEFGSILSQLKVAKHYLSDGYFDFDKSEKWLKRLTESGSLFATFELFNLYNEGRDRNGIISEYSHQRAIELLKAAADKKHIEALYQLGVRELSNGDTKEIGTEHIIDASLAGHLYAKKLLEKYDWELPGGNVLAASGDLYNDTADAFSIKARELYYKIEASNQGEAKYTHSVGDFYNEAELYDDAATWYKKSSDLGNDDARYNLAILHQDFKLNHSDLDEALRLLEKLVKQRDFDAIHTTGRISVIQKKYAKAVAYFRAAALIAPTNDLKLEELEYANRFAERFESADEKNEAEEIYNYLVKYINK